ncbi:putative enol-lactone hydrolase [Cladophialophora carrionii]|uniref:Putative enol-lactone hydrolase n=1 Tax=Cladophialophora carrionii TaxID=86049 RepID=A0A1C1CH82_9EURO|nr:putative enol-lactone hydrolase [Cladophialophora carrionii]
MPYLDRNGVKIYYQVHDGGNDSDSDSKAPLLLLTHGFSSTSAMWKAQIPALSRHFTLIIWDMRGHGHSDYPTDPAAYSESHTVGDMAAILDAVGGTRSRSHAPAIVGGLSLGGYMSLAFYRKYPARVAALLIIDTGPGFRNDDARRKWNDTAEQTARSFEARGLSVLGGMSAERAGVAHLHKDAKGLARAARGMLAQRDARVIASLGDVKVPSLVVVGAEDTPFLAASEYMARKIPGARKVVVPRAGHAVNIDNPDGFLEAVMPFLDEVRREGGGGGGDRAKL